MLCKVGHEFTVLQAASFFAIFVGFGQIDLYSLAIGSAAYERTRTNRWHGCQPRLYSLQPPLHLPRRLEAGVRTREFPDQRAARHFDDQILTRMPIHPLAQTALARVEQ